MFLGELELIDKNIGYHNQLNPAAWDDGELKPSVRNALLDVAQSFIEFLNVDKLDVREIVLTGSNANYNWTQFSDFDVHVVVSYSALTCDNLASELFRAKKDLWNHQHDITIKGFDVELYVEDVAEPPVAQGIYSLTKDTWIRRPTHKPPAFNDSAVEAKAIDLMMTIDQLVDSQSEDILDYKRLKNKIRKMRKSGLQKGGEFSVENLAFKILRNEGYIAKLSDAEREMHDRSLTIEQAV